jgi:hypothetical protein
MPPFQSLTLFFPCPHRPIAPPPPSSLARSPQAGAWLCAARADTPVNSRTAKPPPAQRGSSTTRLGGIPRSHPRDLVSAGAQHGAVARSPQAEAWLCAARAGTPVNSRTTKPPPAQRGGSTTRPGGIPRSHPRDLVSAGAQHGARSRSPPPPPTLAPHPVYLSDRSAHHGSPGSCPCRDGCSPRAQASRAVAGRFTEEGGAVGGGAGS